MTAVGIAVLACAFLLAAAGIAKLIAPAGAARMLAGLDVLPSRLVRPGIVRLLAALEVGMALYSIAAGTRLAFVLLAISYVTIALVALRAALHMPTADCGCFGANARSAPAGWTHAAVTVIATAVASAAAATPVGPFGGAADAKLITSLSVASAMVLTWLAYLVLAVLPTVNTHRTSQEVSL